VKTNNPKNPVNPVKIIKTLVWPLLGAFFMLPIPLVVLIQQPMARLSTR
jgi:hypothetical protein